MSEVYIFFMHIIIHIIMVVFLSYYVYLAKIVNVSPLFKKRRGYMGVIWGFV
ncbi:hypothetical protein MPF_1813 [Methanohalophilus portucalensis FDF-1]|uniref:Uncharacterized protein n=1 Tax=Methanohalophilus portucalensis FDF-1 TaxID=523843 RepID=A0A1L9C2S4_9EURY|nr:hypothetical protein MPF_1813 [Methanohalophilus portucalensis FDF-1]